MSLDEVPTEVLTAAAATTKRLMDTLESAANDILKAQHSIAQMTLDAAVIKDRMDVKEAANMVYASTEKGADGKHVYPNGDAQKAFVVQALFADSEYETDRESYRIIQREIEIAKAEITRLHEKRKDTNVEKELIIALTK